MNTKKIDAALESLGHKFTENEKRITVSLERWEELRSEYIGVCLSCGEESEGHTEPDVDDYRCESCGEDKVHGAEMLLVMNLVE